MMSFPDLEILTSHVSRIFRVEDVTAGNGKEVIARYRGHLVDEDSIAAYDQLAKALLPYNITPLFRKYGDRQAILLVPSLVLPKRSPRVWINILLFMITILSVMMTGVDIPRAALPAEGSIPFAY